MSTKGGRSTTVAGDGRSAAKGTRSRPTPSRGTASAFGRGGGDDPCIHPTLSRELCREALALYEAAAVDVPRVGKVLGVKQLKGLLRDMGLDWPENQVKDLIYRVRQTASVEKRNEAVDIAVAKAAEEAELASDADSGHLMLPGSDVPFSDPMARRKRVSETDSAAGATTVAPTEAFSCVSSSGGADKEGKAYLDRRLFLEVLTLTLDDSDEEKELRMAWELLDKDGDGILSAQDLSWVLQWELGTHVQFAEAREGMSVTMTPEGCAVGKDFFTGTVVRKDSDRITIRWNDFANNGPPAKMCIPPERAERRDWWDGNGRAMYGAPHRAEELRESLHQADFNNDGVVTFEDFWKAMDTN